MAGLEHRLRALKNERRVTAKEIARGCGVSPQSVQNWLSGKTPRSKHLASLSSYFGVSTDYLVHGERDAQREGIEQELAKLLPQLSTSQIYAVLIIVRELGSKN